MVCFIKVWEPMKLILLLAKSLHENVQGKYVVNDVTKSTEILDISRLASMSC